MQKRFYFKKSQMWSGSLNIEIEGSLPFVLMTFYIFGWLTSEKSLEPMKSVLDEIKWPT